MFICDVVGCVFFCATCPPLQCWNCCKGSALIETGGGGHWGGGFIRTYDVVVVVVVVGVVVVVAVAVAVAVVVEVRVV